MVHSFLCLCARSLGFLLCSFSLFAAQSGAEPVEIRVDPDEHLVNETFLGFCGQWGPGGWYNVDEVVELDVPWAGKQGVMTEEAWAVELERMRYLRPSAIRIFAGFFFLPDRDPSAKPDWETEEMRSLYRYLDFCEAEGIDVMVVFGYSRIGDLQDYSDPRWAELQADLLEHLVETKGYSRIRWVNAMNEPNHHKQSYEDFVALQANLDAALKRRGLDELIGIIGPDVIGAPGWVRRQAEDQPEILDGYARHIYNPALEADMAGAERKLAESLAKKDDPAKPYFVTEFNWRIPRRPERTHPDTHAQGVYTTWQALQLAQAGVEGLFLWQLSDNNHWFGKRPDMWGLWRSKYADPEMSFRPYFYIWSLLSRYVPKDSRIFSGDSGDVMVRWLATEKDGAWTFVAVNRGPTAVEVALSVEDVTEPVALNGYLYANLTDNYAHYRQDNDGFPVPEERRKSVVLNDGFTVEIPPMAVVLWTTPLDDARNE